LPEATLAVRVRQEPKNRYRRETYRTVFFCNQGCAAETAFLELPAHSTKDAIVRFFGGRPIHYREFRELVDLPQPKKTSTQQNASQQQRLL